jgi:hypothetical protein
MSRLNESLPSSGTAMWIFIGQYYNSFRIGLTNP